MLRYAFIVGMVFGIALGWAFHGLISMAVRFGFVALLLIPLLLLAFMWWRSSRERNRMQTTMTVMRWSGDAFPPRGSQQADAPWGQVGFDNGDVVDLNDVRTREQHH
jgi:hypothetical protein